MAILYYLAHDPISNSEAVLTEYDAELIKRADESGIVFIAVDDQGTRSIIPASSKARSAMSFSEALEALRALAYGTVEEGGE